MPQGVVVVGVRDAMATVSPIIRSLSGDDVASGLRHFGGKGSEALKKKLSELEWRPTGRLLFSV